MNDERPFPSGEDGASAGDDWDRRILCSDGNCIGVIGADGRCKECGKPYEGELPESGARDPDTVGAVPPSDTPEEEAGAMAVDEAPAADTAEGESVGDDDWDRRVLCSDGNCIGVIGADGRCTTCGKPYEPESAQ
ncbi:MAG: hypothetical protein WAM73_02240 [Desulfobacterales bacterium]